MAALWLMLTVVITANMYSELPRCLARREVLYLKLHKSEAAVLAPLIEQMRKLRERELKCSVPGPSNGHRMAPSYKGEWDLVTKGPTAPQSKNLGQQHSLMSPGSLYNQYAPGD